MHFYQFFTIFYSLLQIWRGRNNPASNKVEEAEAAQVEEVKVGAGELWAAGEAEERLHSLLQPAHLDSPDQKQPNNLTADASPNNEANCTEDHAAPAHNEAAQKSMEGPLSLSSVFGQSSLPL